MKCVTIQHIEAVAALKKHPHLQPLRTIHLSFVPDEEIGGVDGVAKWVESDHFKSLNIGFALDEGLANPSETCLVFYGERVPWCTRPLARAIISRLFTSRCSSRDPCRGYWTNWSRFPASRAHREHKIGSFSNAFGSNE